MTKEEAIIKLWQIIDDIDTISDLAKGDNIIYRNLVENKQKERWDLPITTNGYSIDLKFDLNICSNCKHYINEVCTNSDCPLCCEFVDKDFGCNLWEGK